MLPKGTQGGFSELRRMVVGLILLLLFLTVQFKHVGLVEASDDVTETWQVSDYDSTVYRDDCFKFWNGDSWVFWTDEFYFGVGNKTNYESMGSGLRWCLVDIPKPAIIVSAYLEVCSSDDASSTVVRSRITGDDEGNATTFTTIEDYEGRPRTSANVTWDNISEWEQLGWYRSPDIKTIIQEIVDREDWSTDNSIVLFWDDYENRSDTNAYREACGRDLSLMWGAKLEVTYSILVVSLSSSASSVYVNSPVTVTWTITRSHDNSTVSDFLINITRNDELIKVNTNESTLTDYFADSYTADYTASAVTDNTYGLTEFTTNTVRVTWEPEEGSSPGGEEAPAVIPKIELPKIKVPEIPVWGYWMIAGVVGVVAIGAILTAPAKKARKTRGVKTRKHAYEPKKLSATRQKRLPKRSKKTGRFQG